MKSIIKFSNDIHIYFALEKEIGKIAILKKHTETLLSILKAKLVLSSISSSLPFPPVNHTSI